MLLLTCLLCCLGSTLALDLSSLLAPSSRGGKQLDAEGGIALGLVSALQKWADSIESESGNLKSELSEVKTSNQQLIKQIQLINSQNLNLKNQVGEANERSMNLKDNYLKTQEQLDKLKEENSNLNRELKGHKDVLNIQIQSSRSNKETISQLQGQLFVAETGLGALQGKVDRFQADTSGQLAAILSTQNGLNTGLTGLTTNFTGFKSVTDSATAEIKINLDSIRLSHAKALTDLSAGFNSTLKNLVTRTEANRKNIDLKHASLQDKFESSFNNLKSQTLQYISSANSQLETASKDIEAVSLDINNVSTDVKAVSEQVGAVKLDVDDVSGEVASNRANIEELKTFRSEMTGKMDMLKAEIVGSAEILTRELANSLESTVKHVVKEDIESLRSNSTELTASLATLSGQLSSVQDLSANLSTEMGQVQQKSAELSQEIRQVKGASSDMSAELDQVKDRSAVLSTDLRTVKDRVASTRQRSIDTASTLQIEIGKYQGKLQSVLTDSDRLESRLTSLENTFNKFNRSHSESSSLQIGTMKGLERLGDSLATLKGDMFGLDYSGQINNLTARLTGFEAQLEPLTASTVATDRLRLNLEVVEDRVDRVDSSVLKLKTKTDGLDSRVNNNQLKLQDIDRDSAKFKSVSDTQLESLATSLTNTRNVLAQIMTRIASLETQAPGSSGGGGGSGSSEAITKLGEQLATLKTNVIGLGNYINSVNRELNSLSGKTKTSVELFSSRLEGLTGQVSNLESDLKSTQRSKNDLSPLSGGPSNPALELDVSKLKSKVQDLAASLFGLSNEVTVVKAGLSRVQEDSQNKYNTRTSTIRGLEVKVDSALEKVDTTRTELNNLRSGIAGLSSNLLSAQGSDDRIKKVEKRVAELSVNMTGVAGLATSTLSELTQLKPEVNLIEADISNIRSGISRLSTVFNSVTDPARFSCGVTGEEVRVSGVIVYDECNVNFDNMMNKGTGHATVPTSGDYMLSFSANMVSSNSQAVWCALYKQSPGDEGWQVLGMINNYQEDAGEVDDRDSGSLTILAKLKEGDQVWVEWRGYGDSFLYSNPYKLISFSGYLIAP